MTRSARQIILDVVPGLCRISFSLCNERGSRGVRLKWANSCVVKRILIKKGEYVMWRGASTSMNCRTPPGHIYSWVHPSPPPSTAHSLVSGGWTQKRPPTTQLNARVFPFKYQSVIGWWRPISLGLRMRMSRCIVFECGEAGSVFDCSGAPTCSGSQTFSSVFGSLGGCTQRTDLLLIVIGLLEKLSSSQMSLCTVFIQRISSPKFQKRKHLPIWFVIWRM